MEKNNNDKNVIISSLDLYGNTSFYDNISHELKSDFDFVKYVIFKYSNNVNFVNKVTKYFIENSNKEEKIIEAIIYMLGIAEDEEEIKKYYQNKIDGYYNEISNTINEYREKHVDQYDELLLGNGFAFVLEKYKSDVIINYFAKRFINDIFINIEYILYLIVNNPKELDFRKRNNIVLNIVKLYDRNLYNYLLGCPNLLANINSKIVNIENNWNNSNYKTL